MSSPVTSTTRVAARTVGLPRMEPALPVRVLYLLAFRSASDGYLFAHEQVRAFSVVYVLLSLCGLLVSIPVWRLLGLFS